MLNQHSNNSIEFRGFKITRPKNGTPNQSMRLNLECAFSLQHYLKTNCFRRWFCSQTDVTGNLMKHILLTAQTIMKLHHYQKVWVVYYSRNGDAVFRLYDKMHNVLPGHFSCSHIFSFMCGTFIFHVLLH